MNVADSLPERGRLPTRADFLVRAGLTFLGAAAGAAPPGALAAGAPEGRRWKGRPDSNVQRWDVVTVGNLSRNRYGGEGDEKGVRPTLCTCTLVRGADFRLLVDPSVADAAGMARELDRRTGLKPADITA